jgi:predicted transcriptional regulator
MATFTSTLPDVLWEQLNTAAKTLKQPKNKLIERALEIYLDQLNRAAYLKSSQIFTAYKVRTFFNTQLRL